MSADTTGAAGDRIVRRIAGLLVGVALLVGLTLGYGGTAALAEANAAPTVLHPAATT